jgi:hypothetical protein
MHKKMAKGELINHTSITDSEFEYLLPLFEKAFDVYFKYNTIGGNGSYS